MVFVRDLSDSEVVLKIEILLHFRPGITAKYMVVSSDGRQKGMSNLIVDASSIVYYDEYLAPLIMSCSASQ
jgi:hypothetical protein